VNVAGRPGGGVVLLHPRIVGGNVGHEQVVVRVQGYPYPAAPERGDEVGLTAAPVVASYSPTRLLPLSTTNRWLLRSSASPKGLDRPAMKLRLMSAPVVASYSLTRPLKPRFSTTNRWLLASTVSPWAPVPPTPVMKFALMGAPVVASYFPTVPPWDTKICAW